jgi:ABC-type branched-subunit amino acid transport system substrate-binding protein
MIRSLSLLFASVFLLAACKPATYTCTDPLGCLEIPPDSPLVIGVLTTLSGQYAPTGTEVLASIQFAVDETGPILNHKVDLVWQSTDCTEESARLAAALLVQTPDLLAVIGPSCLADAAFSIPVFEDAGIAVLTPTRSGDTAFRQLAEAIQEVTVSQNNGTLNLPRTALQKTLETQP